MEYDVGVSETIIEGTVRLRFPREWLTPVTEDESTGEWIEDPDREYAEIAITDGITIDQNGTISYGSGPEFELDPAMIGDTGFVVEGEVALDFSKNGSLPVTESIELPNGESLPDSWQGAVFTETTLHFPDEMGLPIDDISLEDFHVGTGGVTGTVSLGAEDAMPAPDEEDAYELFGVPYQLSGLDVQFVQNAPVRSDISGAVLLPFFDDPVDVDIGIGADGSPTVGLSNEDGLYTLEKEFMAFEVNSFEFDATGDVPAVTVGGTFDLDLDDAVDADLDVPSIEVDAVTVDAEGNVDVDGGWIDLRDQYAVEIGPASLEVTSLGFGSTDAGGKWIGLNGSVKLHDGLPAGASVEGLRVAWDEPGQDGVSVSLDGVGVEFEVPGTLRFAGMVAFNGDEFRGAIDLELLALDMSIDAELVFGTMSPAADDDLDEPFRYFAVELDAGLPGGIPLWATGVAVYGFGALYANNYEPNRTGDQEWFDVSQDPDRSWYHYPDPEEPGVRGLTTDKWGPAHGAMGFGASVDLGTAADVGLSVATDLTLVITFPGPVIMLQGRADMLEPGTVVGDDAPYKAVAILDNRAGSLTVGVDARYDKSPLLDISAAAEAFFEFDDPEAWYLHLGRKDPRSDRIRAEALKIFTAESYLMLDPHRLAMGIWAGYDESWSFGPLSVRYAAYVESDAVLNFEPPHFYGAVQFDGEVSLQAFGTGAGWAIHAGVEADVFTPFHLRGEFTVSMDLPWPLPDPSATVSLEWGPQPDVPEAPKPLQETGVGHPLLASTWADDDVESETIADVDDAGPVHEPDGEVVVPMDCRPELTFARPVTDESGVGGNPSPPDPAWQVIGDPSTGVGPAEAMYELVDLNLYAYDHGEDEWEDAGDLEGAWAPVPETGSGGAGDGGDRMTQTILQVSTRTPYHYGRNTGGAWEDAIDRHYPSYPCSTERHCYGFEDLAEEDFDVEHQYTRRGEFMRIQRQTHAQDTWLEFFLGHEDDPAPAAFFGPTSGPTGERRALSIVDRSRLGVDDHFGDGGDDGGEDDPEYGMRLLVHLPEALQSVRAHLRAHSVTSRGQVRAIDEDGTESEPTAWEIDPGEERRLAFSDVDAAYGTLAFEFDGSLSIVEVCDAATDLAAAGQDVERGVEEARNQLARFSDRGDVLEPYTDYCLEVVTKAHVRGLGDLSGHDETTIHADYVSFRTAGPPGLSTPDVPIGGQAADGDGADRSETGLETLSRYVEGTTPETVPGEGERPPMPRPVYRGDPVGVDFRTDYVDLLYRLANRDLGIYLYDENDEPVRDADGTLVVSSDPWGPTDDLLLDRATRRWFERLAESPCLDLDEVDVERTKRLEVAEEEQVLAPEAVYEARLRPLLFRETWRDDAAGAWTERGDGDWLFDSHDGVNGEGVLDAVNRLTVSDGSFLGDLQAHRDAISFEGDDDIYPIVAVSPVDDRLTVGGDPDAAPGDVEFHVPPRHELRQTDAAVDEAALELDTNPDLEADDPDQPTPASAGTGADPSVGWTDVRVTATLGTYTTDGAIGLEFRRDGNDRYRVELHADGECRLLLAGSGDPAELATADSGYLPGRDHELTVEAVDGTLRVLLDGTAVLRAPDADGPVRGTVGIYCRDSTVRCSELRVDDFRDGAPTAYGFSITTSKFVDARHHVHSFDDEVWLDALPESAFESVEEDAIPDEAPDADEHRRYREVAGDVAGADKLPASLEVTRLLDGDDESPENDGDDEGGDEGGDETTGLFVQSPEPIDWDTTSLTVERGPRFDVPPTTPGELKLIDADLWDGTATVLLRETMDVDGAELQYRRGTTADFEPTLESVAFEHGYDDPDVLSSYLTVDPAGDATWAIEDGAVTCEAPTDRSLAVHVGSSAGRGTVRATVKSPAEGDGTVGVVFRYAGQGSHYRFDLGSDKCRLVSVASGGETELWSGASPVASDSGTAGVRIALDGETIAGFLNGVPLFRVADPTPSRVGLIGVAVEGTGAVSELAFAERPLDSVLLDDPIAAADPSNWTFVKEPPYSTQNLEWEFADGELKEHSNVYGFVGGRFAAPGTYATVGDRSWTDYRVTVSLRSADVGAVGAIGVIFRYQDDGAYYRFSMDSVREYRRLVRIRGAEAELLWWDDRGYEVDREYLFAVECVGDRLVGYLEGQQLFDVRDDGIASGSVGVYCRTNEGARFSSLGVTAPTNGWVPYHAFEADGPLPAGTSFEVVDEDSPAQIDDPHRERRARNGPPATLPADTAHLRVVGSDGEVSHARQFRAADAYQIMPDATALRSEDGSGLLLRTDDPLEPGQYRLTWEPRDDEGQFDEPVTIDIPWER